MSISREEFEAGRIDLSLPIRSILENNAHIAFNAERVQQLLVQMQGRSASVDDVVRALDGLVVAEVVEAREIEGERWYTIHITDRRLGFGRR